MLSHYVIRKVTAHRVQYGDFDRSYSTYSHVRIHKRKKGKLERKAVHIEFKFPR